MFQWKQGVWLLGLLIASIGAVANEDASLSLSLTIHRLLSGGDQERIEATKQLAKLKGAAVPALVEAYRDADPWDRVWVVNGLAAVRHMTAFPALTLALHDDHPKVRQAATFGLARYGEPGFVALTMAFDDPKADQVAVMGALYPLKQPGVVPYLVRNVRHAEVVVRENAAKMLGEFPDHPEVPAALVAALADPHPWVRDGGWQSCRKVGPVMVTAIRPLLRHDQEDVRHSAVQALCYIRHPDTIPDLIGALQDAFYKVRGLALVGLGQLRRPETVPAVLGACRDANAKVRAIALEQLLPFPTKEARAAAAAASRDPDPDVRAAAEQLLGQWRKDPPARPR